VFIYISKSWPELHLTASNVPSSQKELTSSYINMPYQEIDKYRMFYSKFDAFTALRFTRTGAPLAAERMRILLMTQHADNIWNGKKFLPLFTDHRER
jgi:hypothetical protein